MYCIYTYIYVLYIICSHPRYTHLFLLFLYLLATWNIHLASIPFGAQRPSSVTSVQLRWSFLPAPVDRNGMRCMWSCCHMHLWMSHAKSINGYCMQILSGWIMKYDTVDRRNPANHLGCKKPCRSWDKLPISWCRISSMILEEWWLIVAVSLKASNVDPRPKLMLRLVDQSSSLSMILAELFFFEQNTIRFIWRCFLRMFRIYPPGN